MQPTATLIGDGDRDEKEFWPVMQSFVPSYEKFWQLYVVPLRIPKGIWFRDGIDPILEDVAIASYSTFVALARSRQKIYVDHEEYRHTQSSTGGFLRFAFCTPSG